MNIKKKLIALTLVVAIALSVAIPLALGSSSAEEPLLTIACLSDLHTQGDDLTNMRVRDSVTDTVADLHNTEDIDVLVLGGDYTSDTAVGGLPQNRFNAVRAAIQSAAISAFSDEKQAAGNTPILWVTGNHDYTGGRPSYNSANFENEIESTCGFTLSGNFTTAVEPGENCFYEYDNSGTVPLLCAYYCQINNLDFLVLNTGKYLYQSENGESGNFSNYRLSDESVAWISNMLATVCQDDPLKTVFLLTHIPFNDSNSLRDGKSLGPSFQSTTALKNTLSQYPNLVMLYGHDHGGDTAFIRNNTAQRVSQYDSSGTLISTTNYTNRPISGQSGSTGTVTYNSTTTLVDGRTYLITSIRPNESTSYACKTVFDTASTGRLGGLSVTPSGGSIPYSSSLDACEWIWDAGNSAFKPASGANAGKYMNIPNNNNGSITFSTTPRSQTVTNTIRDNTTGGYLNLRSAYNYSSYTGGSPLTFYEKTTTGGGSSSQVTTSFFSAFMGSMRYYSNTIESADFNNGYSAAGNWEPHFWQALLVYVYADRVELQMKNYGATGTFSSSGITLANPPASYINYRTVVSNPTSVTVTPATMELQLGSSSMLTATVAPLGAQNSTVTWSSSNNSVVSVNQSGSITALAAGTAVITARSDYDSSLYDTCEVTVTVPTVSSFTLSPSTVAMYPGNVLNISPEIQPPVLSNLGITWSSNANGVASVDNTGRVTAISNGTAVITAVLDDYPDISAQCTVSVIEANPLVEATLTTDHVAYLNTYSGGRYLKPNNSLSRLDLAISLYNLFDSESKAAFESSEFSLTNLPYADLNYLTEAEKQAVVTVYNAGIIDDVYTTDLSDETNLKNNFNPNTGVTRGELAYILSKFVGVSNLPQSSSNTFSDVNSDTPYADAILTCCSFNWMTGYDNGTFKPNAEVSRLQFVQIMNAFLNRSVTKVKVRDAMPVYDENYFEDVSSAMPGYVSLYEATNSHDATLEVDSGNGYTYEIWFNYTGTEG